MYNILTINIIFATVVFTCLLHFSKYFLKAVTFLTYLFTNQISNECMWLMLIGHIFIHFVFLSSAC